MNKVPMNIGTARTQHRTTTRGIATMHKESLRMFLEERRARIQPEKVGMSRPTGSGRRVPGLSQQHIDTLLNWGIHTYHRLETGNTPNVKPEYLRDLAHLLRLDEHEWVLLNRYALEQDPPAPLHPESGYEIPNPWQDAVDGQTHMSYLGDAAWNVVAYNQRWLSMFPSGRAPENTMRWMCLSQEARTVLIDWETAWAPRILPQLRGAVALRRDPTLLRIEADVRADPIVGPLYEARGARLHSDGDERPLLHAAHGPGWVTMCSSTPESSPGARLMILLFNKTKRQTGRPAPLRAPVDCTETIRGIDPATGG